MPELMSNFDLMGEYYRLNGCGWNADAKHAVFHTQESAKEYKSLAPTWKVYYLSGGESND